MRFVSVAPGYNPQHRAGRPSREAVTLCQQIFGARLEHDLQVLDICTGREARITFRARIRHHQAPWLNRDPELLIVHRGQPSLYVISRFEHFHAAIVSKNEGKPQISYYGGRYDV